MGWFPSNVHWRDIGGNIFFNAGPNPNLKPNLKFKLGGVG